MKKNFKIVDCFTFYNEIDLLKLRLTELNDFVDFFVLSESLHTHRGRKKNSIYLENKGQFSKFNEKIIHVIDEKKYTPNDYSWKIENNQRNMISKGINLLNLSDNDQIIISDLDEIPNVETLKEILPKNWIYTLEMDFYYFSPFNKIKKKWKKSKILDFKTYKEKFNSEPQKVRESVDYRKIFTYRQDRNKIKKGGWHFSYFGDEDFIQNKIINFAHAEYDDEKFYNKQNIQNSISKGVDLYGDKNIKIKKLDKLIYKNLPKNIDLLIK